MEKREGFLSRCNHVTSNGECSACVAKTRIKAGAKEVVVFNPCSFFL